MRVDDFSFQDLERVWISERTSSKLSELPKEFYARVAGCISQLIKELDLSEGLRRELLQEELIEITKMVSEIYSVRMLKAMGEMLRGREVFSLDERELAAFKEMKKILEKAHELMEWPGEVDLSPPQLANELLLLRGEVPRIVGEDLKYYGPFSPGDIVSLPRSTAELLVKHRLAEKIRAKWYFFG